MPLLHESVVGVKANGAGMWTCFVKVKVKVKVKFVRRQSWTFWLQKPEHIKCMVQFRLGSHWLQVQQGRCTRPKQRRHERCCPCCANQVEDEVHIMTCPAYEEWRVPLGLVPHISSDDGFRTVMNLRDERGWYKLADFLVRCKQTRTET